MNNPLFTTASPRFVHLRTRSRYSMLDGMLTPETLVTWAKSQNCPALAMADDHNLFGVMDFALAANKAGVQPLIGAAIRLEQPEHCAQKNTVHHYESGRKDSVILLVQNAQGYENLNKLVTSLYLPIFDTQADAAQATTSQPQAVGLHAKLSLQHLCAHAEGLILLSGGIEAPLGQMLLRGQLDEARQWLDTIQGAFPQRVFLEIQRHHLPGENRWHEALVPLADQCQLPLVATNDCRFQNPSDFPYHQALTAVATSQKVSELNDLHRISAEFHLRSAQDMHALFADLPDALANSLVVAQMCKFTLEDRSTRPKMPEAKNLPPGMQAKEFLLQQTTQGLRQRLEAKDITWESSQALPYKERMNQELMIINQSGFAGYFLIVEDLIAFARREGIPVGPGRGSGVGSLVAWALKITALDPLQFNLLFERFLHLERISVPDFDIDFCAEKRDIMINYAAQAYGEDCVSQIITFGKLRSRGALRDIGRVLGMPYGAVDRLCKLLPKEDLANPQTLEQIRQQEKNIEREISQDPEIAQLWRYAEQLEGCYRNASTHAAGVVIADHSLIGEVALYYDPRNNLKATQLNMKSAEKAGLVKFDFLGLGTLTIMTAAAQDIQRLYQHSIDFDTLALDDSAVFRAISQGHTMGMFQLESAGMRRVAVQLRPDCFTDIIAMVALFRPGPMDNIPNFIACKHGDKAITYPHPLLQDILEETYGIAVYQEQIMQMTQKLAGFNLGKADELRRAMGKKDAAILEQNRQEFINEAHRLNNIPLPEAEKIFETIRAFAAYGFNKSHSAAYGMIAYWTGWLKVHYPDCMLAALLNNAINSPNTIAQYLIELKRLNLILLPPDINSAQAYFSLPSKRHIRYGLGGIRGVGIPLIQEIIAEREAHGPFHDLGDLVKRTRDMGVNRKLLQALITGGACDSIIPNRHSAYNMIDQMIDYARHCREIPQEGNMLFTPELPEPPAMALVPEWGGLEKLRHEFVALGFHLSQHPLDLYQQHLVDFGVTAYAELDELESLNHREHGVRIAGYVYDRVMTRTRPNTRKPKSNAKKQAKKSNPTEATEPLLILRMSDAGHRFQVSLEGQNLIDETLAILSEENLLLIDAQARKDQIEWRLNGFRVRHLPHAVPDNRDESFSLRLKDLTMLPKVQKLLQKVALDDTKDAARQIGSRVSLKIDLPQGLAEIDLTGQHYRINLETRRALAAIPSLSVHVSLDNPYLRAMREHRSNTAMPAANLLEE